jgi:hypothetical protein
MAHAALQYLVELLPCVPTVLHATSELVAQADINVVPDPARLFQVTTPAPFDSIPFRQGYLAAIRFHDLDEKKGQSVGWTFRALLGLKDLPCPDSATLPQFINAARNRWIFGSKPPLLKVARASRRCEREYIDALLRGQVQTLRESRSNVSYFSI